MGIITSYLYLQKNNKAYIDIGWISSSKDVIYKFNYQGGIKDAFKYLSDIQQVSK